MTKAEHPEAAHSSGSAARDLGTATASAGAAIVATAATACCVPVISPLIVSVLGVSGAVWAASLEPWAGLILSASGVLVAAGVWIVHRPRPILAGDACAPRPTLPVRTIVWTAAGLWVFAAVLWIGRFLY